MKILNNIKLIEVKNSNDKVGIQFNGSEIEIMVPSAFRVENNEKILKKDLLCFLKSLSIAKQIEYDDYAQNKGSGKAWPIESFLWIIRDFLENGYFYNREKVYSNDRNKKIEWKKTLKTVPIISDGNLIFDKLTTSKMSASNDIIAHTYKTCLKQSIDKIGWLFSYALSIEVMPIFSIKEMLHEIKKELSSTYDDIKITRFKHMMYILESIDDSALLKNKFNYSIENYYYVYEQMIDSLFEGIKGDEKKKYNPSGYWKLNNQKPSLASNLRPDTIYRTNSETYIIDAKMYQYGCTHDIKDLPETSSMQKQITYGDYILNKVDTNTKVRNAFLLPYNKDNPLFINDKNIIRYNSSNLAYIGEAYVDWRNESIKLDHERIFAFLIDFNYLLNNFKQPNHQIDLLIDSIQTILNEKNFNNELQSD